MFVGVGAARVRGILIIIWDDLRNGK